MRLPLVAHPFLLWQSILAGVQTVAGVAYLADIMGGRSAAVLVVLTAAAQAATTFYAHGVAQAQLPPVAGR